MRKTGSVLSLLAAAALAAAGSPVLMGVSSGSEQTVRRRRDEKDARALAKADEKRMRKAAKRAGLK